MVVAVTVSVSSVATTYSRAAHRGCGHFHKAFHARRCIPVVLQRFVEGLLPLLAPPFHHERKKISVANICFPRDREFCRTAQWAVLFRKIIKA